MPSFERLQAEIGLVIGQKVLLKEELAVANGCSPREVFRIIQGPVHGNTGLVILLGLLGDAKLVISSDENVILKRAD
jgi:hypothetical protein